MSGTTVNVIGGGLAGSELAYQLGARGIDVRLFEMRPTTLTPAHRTGNLAELVCSNTFKSMAPHSAPGILKEELKSLGSLLVHAAPYARVPAGEALAVDREAFSREVEAAVLSTGRVERFSARVENIAELPEAHTTVVATGPLTQGGLADFVASLSGSHGLYFYDAIAPVVDAASVDRTIAFAASRYGKGGDDYLNCPMTREEYDRFYDALMSAEKVAFHDFEEAKYFQGCQPIEAIAETGRDSPRFGPMKPVGLVDPRTGTIPYAVVQLRIDNLSRSAYNLVGFQTKLKYGEQTRVFRMIPGLENAEFLRLGSMHRNTYVCTPLLLDHFFALKGGGDRRVRLAGQITGVEGYTESSAIGLLCAMGIWAELGGGPWSLPPRASALGSLCHYLFSSPAADFQPQNVHFGLFDAASFDLPAKRMKKIDSRATMGRQAVANISKWRDGLGWNAKCWARP